MQNFVFKDKSVHYWRAQTQHVRNFSDLVRWFEREHGLGKGRAINAARMTRGDLYNQFHARHHGQSVQTITHNTSSRPVQSMRHRSGAQMFAFKGV